MRQINEKLTLADLILTLNPILRDIYTKLSKTSITYRTLEFTGYAESNEIIGFNIPENSEVIAVTPSANWRVIGNSLVIEKVPRLLLKTVGNQWTGAGLVDGTYYSPLGNVEIIRNGEYFDVKSDVSLKDIQVLPLYNIQETYKLIIREG